MKLIREAQHGVGEGFCLIKSVEQKTTAKKQAYLDMVLTDAQGEVSAKLWDYSPERHGRYEAGMVIKVRGSVDTWNNAPQLRIERIRHADEKDQVDMASLVPCAPYTSEWMFDQLTAMVDAMQNADIAAVVRGLLEQNRERILICPAAVKMHHAVRSGLLYHTLSIARAAQALCAVYPFLNRDLVLAGVILHDLDKIHELEVSKTGTASGYTVHGQLLGHLVGGVVGLERMGEQLGTPREILELLQHMVLSHHAIPEFGSPIPPMFPEAEVVSALDTLDATLYEMNAALENVAAGQFTGKVWGLDRKLYQHGMASAEPGAKLDLN